MILDGSRRCFAQWQYAGGASVTLQRDGTVQTGGGADGLGVLWFAARPYGDFSLRLQFRDDATAPARANSGVQVRFPAPKSPTPGCPTTFDGNEEETTRRGSRSTAATRSRSTTRPTAGPTIPARPARSTASPTWTRPPRA